MGSVISNRRLETWVRPWERLSHSGGPESEPKARAAGGFRNMLSLIGSCDISISSMGRSPFHGVSLHDFLK